MKSKQCNVCGKNRPLWWYKTPNKKTCGKCEYNPWKRFLRTLGQALLFFELEPQIHRSSVTACAPAIAVAPELS